MNEEIFEPILPIIEFENINLVVSSSIDTWLKQLSLLYLGKKK